LSGLFFSPALFCLIVIASAFSTNAARAKDASAPVTGRLEQISQSVERASRLSKMVTHQPQSRYTVSSSKKIPAIITVTSCEQWNYKWQGTIRKR
jgi:hypothetical protein